MCEVTKQKVPSKNITSCHSHSVSLFYFYLFSKFIYLFLSNLCTPHGAQTHNPEIKSHMLWMPGWLSGWVSALGSGRDPGVLGSSPTSGSLHGAYFSFCLGLCLSLCLSWINKILEKNTVYYFCTKLKKSVDKIPYLVQQFILVRLSYSSQYNSNVSNHNHISRTNTASILMDQFLTFSNVFIYFFISRFIAGQSNFFLNLDLWALFINKYVLIECTKCSI